MSIATFKDLCLDADDADRVGEFWAQTTKRQWHPDEDLEGCLLGQTARHTIWVNRVPDPRRAKYRVHLDVYTCELDELVARGATVVETFPRWTVMTDPEGAEFCAFVRDEVPAERLHGVVVDSPDPIAVATWWAAVLGADLDVKDGWATVEHALWDDVVSLDFVPVPEPKSGKNRVHWDVTGSTDELLARGATLLRRRNDEIGWDVLADPEDNGFCVFAP